MKKIINGKLYNTETAKCLGEWNNGERYGEFTYCEESLYKTKSGAYFIHGWGGPLSKYAKSDGNNSWSGGSHIEPVSYSAARDWAEEHLDADEYMELFGEVEEAGTDKEATLIYLTSKTKFKLERMKSETGKSLSQIIEEKFTD